jgi:Pretoxin HINT domain/DNA/RNA non-specific endonuclease
LQSAWNTTQDVAGRVADGAGYWAETFQPITDDLSDRARGAIDFVARYSTVGVAVNAISTTANIVGKVGNAIHKDWQDVGRNTDNIGDQILFTADKLIAGFADGATLGATTRIRESIYGDKIKSQHQGAIFTTGQVVGIAAVTIVSAGAGSNTLGARILTNSVKTGLKVAPIAGLNGAGMSILHDIDKGKLFDGGALDRALEAGVEGAIGGFKFGAELGGAGVLGLPGKAWQTKLLVEGAAGSTNKAIDHFQKGEYFSGTGELLNALLAAKDAGKHAGEFVGDAQGAYQARRNRGAESVGAQPHGLPIGETTRIPGVELSPEAPVHPRELPREVISDPWLEPVGEINRSIEFPTNSNRSPYAEISDPWSNCFVAGTKIWTINGEKNIEDIKVGDWVLSDDPTTVGGVIYKQVLQTFNHDATTTIDIFIDGEKITTTEEHPFWVPDVGWVKAKDLNAGTHLQTKTESWLDIDKVDKHIELTKVYNFEVEGFHTYFVSDLGFLVHNICNDPVTRTFTDVHDLNRAANVAPEHRANQIFEFGDHKWTTDTNGRVIRAEGSITLDSVDGRRGTDGVGTQSIGKHSDAQPGDVGFHLIGDQFAGPSNWLNVVPGNGTSVTLPNGAKLMSLNLSRYKIDFENRVKDLAKDPSNNVEVIIEPVYDVTNSTLRPDQIMTSHRVNGGVWKINIFENKAGG